MRKIRDDHNKWCISNLRIQRLKYDLNWIILNVLKNWNNQGSRAAQSWISASQSRRARVATRTGELRNKNYKFLYTIQLSGFDNSRGIGQRLT